MSNPNEIRIAVYIRDDYTCQHCGLKGRPGSKKGCIQAHHIVPSAEGGPDTMENMVTLCVECHLKQDRARWAASMRRWQERLGYKKLTQK